MRRYDAKTRRFADLSFSQTSDAGRMSVRGKRSAAGFECITTAGGADHKAMTAVQETLDHALAVYPLVSKVGAHAGDEVTVPHFDAQAQAETWVHLHIDRIDDALVGGVATKMFTLTTSYKDMGVKEQSTFDGTGKLIATHMGGFFEARLEPEDVAKKLDLVQDVLMQAVIKTPKPIARA